MFKLNHSQSFAKIMLMFAFAVFGGTAREGLAQIVVTDLGDNLVTGNEWYELNTSTFELEDATLTSDGFLYVNFSEFIGTEGQFSNWNQNWYNPTSSFLDPGDVVDGTASFAGNHRFGASQGDGTSFVDAYTGIRLNDGGTGTDFYYGWIRFSYDENSGITLHEAAFESTAGTGITVGATSAVPEPSTAAALLGLATMVVATGRRRRRHSETTLRAKS